MNMLTNKKIVGAYVLPDGTVNDAVRPASMPGYLWDAMYDLYIDEAPTSTAYCGVRIGSGVTPATADDYTLESIITSGLSVVKPSAVTVTKENDCVAVYATYTVTNTGKTAVHISEIGLYAAAYYSTSLAKPALADRTVLESPITINPGEAKPITYTIRLNYPVE